MADSGTNGGGSGGSSFDGNVTIKKIEKDCNIKTKNYVLPYTKERFIQECAMSLYANMNFDNPYIGGMSENFAAKKAVSRAITLAREFEYGNVKFAKEENENN